MACLNCTDPHIMNILTFCFYDQYWLRYLQNLISNGRLNGAAILGFPNNCHMDSLKNDIFLTS